MFQNLKIVVSLFMFLITQGVYGQQESQYSLYMYDPGIYNPAFAGLDETLTISGIYRAQWTGITGAPEHQMLHAQAPMYILQGGVGIFFENERLGAERSIKAFGTYAKHLQISNNMLLSIGARVGVIQKGLDGRLLRTPEGDYETGNINHNDGRLPVTNVTDLQPEAGLGFYLQHDAFSVGLAVTNLLESSFDLFDSNGAGTVFDLERTYVLTGSYTYSISDVLNISPSVLVKSNTVQTQTDINITLDYDDLYFVGLGLRGYNNETIDALLVHVAMRLADHFTIGYGYDWTLSDLEAVSNGSHEVMLTYKLNKPLGKGKLPQIIYNPRYY